MCAVSVITDYMAEVPKDRWTRDTVSKLETVLELIDRLDGFLDQPDCEDSRSKQLLRLLREQVS